jgi:tetratricopeptide (TPR) repeat protein
MMEMLPSILRAEVTLNILEPPLLVTVALLALSCGGSGDAGIQRAEACCTCVAGLWSPVADCTLMDGLGDAYASCAAGSGYEGAYESTAHHLRAPGALAALDAERRERALARCGAMVEGGEQPVADSTRGLLLLEAGRSAEALTVLEARAQGTWLGAYPAIAQEHLQGLARAQREEGAPAEAERTLERARWLEELGQRKGRGWSLEREGRVQEALALWEELLEREPDDVDALLGSVRMLVALGRPEEADPAVRRLLALAPDQQEVQVQAGIARFQQGQDGEAEEHFLAAIAEGEGSNSCPYEGLGLVYLRQGRTPEAREQLETAIALAPDEEYKKYDAMARILMAEGDLDGAARMLSKSRENKPDGAEAAALEAELERLRSAAPEEDDR